MIRLLLTTVFCALASLQAGAQNKVSETLLALGQEERNEAFTDLLRDGDVKCDRVIRTLFNGATSDLDVWEALCRDRNPYSLTILSDQNADIAKCFSTRQAVGPSRRDAESSVLSANTDVSVPPLNPARRVL
jgi:hypothetical protein